MSTKISNLTTLTEGATLDLIPIVDVSDVTDSPEGTTKKIAISNLFSGATNPGIIVNSLTTIQRDALSSVNGNIIYNTTSFQLQTYGNGQWTDISKSPGTKVIAPEGSGYQADYYTSGLGDDVQIQQGIEAISVLGGGDLYIVNIGIYDISQTINGRSNVNIIAQEGTIFRLSNNANVDIISLDGINNITVRGLHLDGNKANQVTTGRGINILGNSFNFRIRDLYISNTAKDGIKIYQANDFILEDIKTYQCGKSGLTVQGNGGFNLSNANDFKMSNCKADGCDFEGFNYYACYDFEIQNCNGLNSVTEHGSHPNLCFNFSIIGGEYNTNGNTGLKIIDCYEYQIIGVTANSNINYGITAASNISIAHGVKIIGCTANSNVRGIYASKAGGAQSDTVIGGNTVIGNTQWGIGLSGVSNSNVYGNISKNNQYGIILSGTCLNNTITGNRCYDDQVIKTQLYGFVDSDYSTIVGNDFSGNKNGEISNLGVNSIVFNSGGRNQLNNANGIALNITPKGASVGSTDKNGGDLDLFSGIPTGTGNSSIRFWTYKPSFSTSTVDAILVNSLIINQTASGSVFVVPANALTNANGNFTSYGAMGAGSGSNKNGGTLALQGGRSTGIGTSIIEFRTASPTTGSLTTLSSISINNGGSGYTIGDVLTISGGGGTGGTATVLAVSGLGRVNASSINNGGSGYTIGDVLTISGGGGNATITVSTLDVWTGIQTYIRSGGTGYSTAINVSLTGGTGTGATLDINSIYSTDAILTISLTTIGTGYSSTTGAGTTGGTGTGATLDITPFSNSINSPTTKVTILGNGNVGIGVTSPTAVLHLAAGTIAAGTAPFKLTTGTALTTPEDGAIEYHGSHLYFTIGSTRFQLDQQTGAGDVAGPSSATDNAVARFDGTTGKLIQNSGVTIDDSGNITATNLSGTNTGNQTITLTGNVTGSGTGSFATTIANTAVTNAMLAGSITASKLIGTDIATVGTITAGTWTGTTIAVANGGTGDTTPSGARTNLGAANIAGDTFTGLILFSGTTHAGIQLNTLTTTQRNALTPAAGMLIRNSTLSRIQYYTGTVWNSIPVRLDELDAPTGNVDMGNQHLANLIDPASPQDAATMAYVDLLKKRTTFKTAVRVATAAVLPSNTPSSDDMTATANGALSIDGVTLSVDDRVLVKDETSGQYNGIYYVAITGDASNPWRLIRPTDANSLNTAVREGIVVYVGQGTANSDTGWLLTTNSPITVGTTVQTYTKIYGSTMSFAGLLVGGSGSPTAYLQLAAGTATASTAPLKFTSGTNLTTAEAGAFEYDGTNLYFTRSGTTRENVVVAVDNASAPSTNLLTAFTNYYGVSMTNALGTPNRWISVNILGTVYKIPMYT